MLANIHAYMLACTLTCLHAYMYADMLFKKPSSDLTRQYNQSREQMRDIFIRLDDQDEFMDRPLRGKYDRDERMYSTDWEAPFNWSKFLDYKLKYTATQSQKEYIKQIILGLPVPHKDARVITTLDVVLVPEHFETAIRQIEARMRELAGQYVEYDIEKNRRKIAPYLSQYFKPKVQIYLVIQQVIHIHSMVI